MVEVEEVLVQRQKIDYKYNEDNILKELQEYRQNLRPTL